MDDLDKRIAEANDEFISDEEEPVSGEPGFVPSDLYQAQRDISYDYGKKQFPRGARAIVLATIKDVINGAGADSLAQAYERAKDDSESLRSRGENARAQIVANQYMEEKFLPAVEVVVNFTSPDELLNSERGLRELDKYALGIGSMTGYTAAYIREAYGDVLGRQPSTSSPRVTDTVRRINGYLDTDQSMLARSTAKKLKEQIDKGAAIASEEDYRFLDMVANNWPKS